MGKNRFSGKDLNSLFSFKNEFPEYFRYHGRKISKNLSKNSFQLLKDHYQQYSLDEIIINYLQLKKKNNKLNFSTDQFDKVNIEIGFGDGEFLLNSAISKPRELFIGSELYLNGIVKVLKKVQKLKIKNLRLINLNSVYLLKSLRCKSVDRIYIINPDPWIKKKHHKRRLISSENIKLLYEVIKSRKSIYITTDSKDYLNSIKKIFQTNTEIFGHIDISLLTKTDQLYGISRYQRKAIEKGGNIYLLKI